jgi:RNA polymerase sigma factor (sigma-70 family)
MVRLRPGDVQRELRTVFTSGTVAGLTDAELLDRFLGRRDDGASFEALVARHGPMVLGVCRDLLGDEHAADDAFQATFLVLVRKAATVRVGDSLGRWLHGVAHRVARHARCDAARRRRREEAVAGASTTVSTPAADAERAELRAALHDELARLPASFRAPIVLCHLEGLTHEEAAQQLRCPVGMVRSRLARGRDRLRGRLVRRGVAPAAALVVLERSSRAAVPATLVASTAGTAARFAGGAGVGAISTTVLTLTKGVLFSMTLGPIKVAATGLMAVGLISVAASGVVAQQGKPATAEKPNPPPSVGTTPVPPQHDNQILRQKDRMLAASIVEDLEQALLDIEVRGQVGNSVADVRRAIQDARVIVGIPLPPLVPAPPTPSAPPTLSARLAPTTPATTTDPFAAPSPGLDPLKSEENASPVGASSQEMIGEYRRAQYAVKLTDRLYALGEANFAAPDSARARLERARNRIEGQVERYRDELELLRVRLKKQADVLRAQGQYEGAKARTDRNERLNKRIKGSVSEDQAAKDVADLKAADGALKVAQVEVEMVQVQIRQVERHLAPLQRFLESNKPPVPVINR